MTFMQQLAAAWQRNDSLLCVGLDPEPERFPAALRGRADALYTFCTAIADATADLVCCFKPQIAHFAAHGAEEQLCAIIVFRAAPALDRRRVRRCDAKTARRALIFGLLLLAIAARAYLAASSVHLYASELSTHVSHYDLHAATRGRLAAQ